MGNPDTQKTALYRHFDSEGRLLYVGISVSAINRLKQHMSGAQWAMEISEVRIEWFADRASAERAERLAIMNEKPIYNKILNQNPPAPHQTGNAKLLKELQKAAKAYGVSALARDIGVSRQGLIKAVSDNGNPSIELLLKIVKATGLRLSVAPI